MFDLGFSRSLGIDRILIYHSIEEPLMITAVKIIFSRPTAFCKKAVERVRNENFEKVAKNV